MKYDSNPPFYLNSAYEYAFTVTALTNDTM